MVSDEIKTYHKSQNLHVIYLISVKVLFHDYIKEFSIIVTVFLETKHCSLALEVKANSPAVSEHKETEIVKCGFQVNWMLSRFL